MNIALYNDFKKNRLQIATNSKKAGINNKKGFLIIRLVNYLNIKSILEIGTSNGMSTAALSIGNSKAVIQTLEDCEKTGLKIKSMFEKFNFNNITITTGKFEETLKPLILNKRYDLIYFNGNQQKIAALHCFKECLNTIHNESVFIFNNIYLNKEMLETWEEIKEHPLVTVTINTYFWGIVFFRREQAKQHFTIRI